MTKTHLAAATWALALATPARASEPEVTLSASLALPASPHLKATRIARPPVIDGRPDDEAWRSVPVTSAFVQKFPREGHPPSEPTSLQIAYDDEAVYVAVACEQRTSPVDSRLTRRDRQVESDWVSVAFDTRGDGKSAFDFTVNAAGVLVDSIRYDDTQVSADWDENWDARTAATASGWAAEVRIPLRILRFASVPHQSWGLQVRRYVSGRHETDEWAFIPRSTAGEVSQYGKLDDLRDLGSPTALEVSPFVVGRFRRRDLQDGQLARGSDFAGSAGLDLKWHPSQELTLDAAINPDFAQVEADQVIMNLSNFEMSLPEKRRFFLEGIDTFATPHFQLLYTRRIGRATPAPALREGEQLVDAPAPATIYGAAKLTGHVGEAWEVGALSTVTGRNDVEVERPDGARERRLADSLSLFNVVRAKRALGDNGHVGVLATSVVRAEPAGENPIVAGPAPAPHALCPDGTEVAPGRRCTNDAYVAGLDWRWRSASGDYVTTGQAVGSMLDRGPSRVVPDGSVIAPHQLGTGFFANLSKEGGAHWLWNVFAHGSSRTLDLNDAGYAQRANFAGGGAEISYRTLEPWGPTLESTTRLEFGGLRNLDGLTLQNLLQLDLGAKLANFWQVGINFHCAGAAFDDYEIGDGAALESHALCGNQVRLETDPRARVSLNLGSVQQLFAGGMNLRAEVGLTLRALPQLDVEIIPELLYTHGETRFAGNGADGAYVFGRLAAQSIGTVVRATYTFTPRLTLQTYGQLFLSSRHFSDFASFDPATAAPRPAIRRRDLRAGAAAPERDPDGQEGALNLNVVLRWELRPGSLLYFVYTRSQSPAAAAGTVEGGGVMRGLDLGALRRGPAADVVLLKLAYWWG